MCIVGLPRERRGRPAFATATSTIGAPNVRLSGSLSTTFTSEHDADDMQLISAAITAGGTVVYLDWSGSSRIRSELLWWSIPRAGDYRGPHADVTGRMVFKPFSELNQKAITVPHGVSANTPVPVVVVESIKVYLAASDGKPRGRQPDRGVVEAETTTDVKRRRGNAQHLIRTRNDTEQGNR